MKVRFTPAADRQYLAALAHILADRPDAARRFHRRALESLERLKRFPESGRRIPEFPDLPFRELILPPFRFFYRVEQRTVWIVGVWHDAQLPIAPADDEGAGDT